jgi:hypothetical protein
MSSCRKPPLVNENLRKTVKMPYFMFTAVYLSNKSQEKDVDRMCNKKKLIFLPASFPVITRYLGILLSMLTHKPCTVEDTL